MEASKTLLIYYSRADYNYGISERQTIGNTKIVAQILKDLIDSEIVPVVKLNELYRQKEDSYIINLSTEINNGILSENFTEKRSDYNFIETPKEQIEYVISELCKKALEKGYDYNQVQVLVPMYKGLNGIDNLNNNDFVRKYLDYWMASFESYCTKDDSTNIFWLTNACGKPSNLPDDWTGGVTCISDEKTSVGMDRTDDIKKGIYQVLKLGAEGKLKNTGWDCKVGIISNIHPARHFNVYLKPIKDLIWTIGNEKSIKIAGDLDPNTPMYNLFDGVVTFTDNYIRDPWLSDNLKMIIK